MKRDGAKIERENTFLARIEFYAKSIELISFRHLIDIVGNSLDVNYEATNGKLTFDVSTLDNGMYMLLLNGVALPFVKQNN
mgnify:CR=1 FL=1